MSPVANEPPPFLDPAPPPWAARALATVLLALFVVTMAALVLVKVPETVSAAFIVEPTRGNDPVRTLHDGTVASVTVEDAQAVDKGQVLFVLSSEPVGDRAAEGQTLDARIEGRSERVANERQRFENRQHADEQEQRRLEQRLVNLQQLATLKQQQLVLSREIAARMRQSLESGVSSWMDASKPQLDVDRLAADLQQVEVDIADSKNLLSRIAFEMASNASYISRAFDFSFESFHSVLKIRAVVFGLAERIKLTSRPMSPGHPAKQLRRQPAKIYARPSFIHRTTKPQSRIFASLTHQREVGGRRCALLMETPASF